MAEAKYEELPAEGSALPSGSPLKAFTSPDGDVFPGIYLAESQLEFFGMTIGTRMTVIVLSNGDLFVHSPVKLTAELREAVDSLGPVRHVISPNKIHNVFMEPWGDAYPDALLYASPGLRERRKDVRFHASLEDGMPDAWADDLQMLLTEGNHFFSEAVFYHPATQLLLVCDMVESHGLGASMGCMEKSCLACFIGRMPPRGYFASPEHTGYTTDLAALQRTRTMVNTWPFKTILMSHGTIVWKEAKEVMDEVFDKWHEDVRSRNCCVRGWMRFLAATQ